MLLMIVVCMLLAFGLTSMHNNTEEFRNPELVEVPLSLELSFTFPLQHYWTHCVGKANVFGCSWHIWCCWEKDLKPATLLSSNYYNASTLWYLQIMSAFFLLSSLSFCLGNPAICNVIIGERFQNITTNFILHSLSEAKRTVSSSKTSSK